MTFESRSPEETFALGVALGKRLRAGDFVGLVGDLGAGKTQFVRGVAEGAGVPRAEVSSPTFAIVQPYAGRLTLHHADLYRLETADELYATGYFDLLDGDGALLVEWVDRIAAAVPADALILSFSAPGETLRRLQAAVTGSRSAALLAVWEEAVADRG
ncbi:MAG TPA: tRNA (adenosine(37)-N6)-threonylcarbamoyltransferase complex ATPase subunit type 1 TsaE [Myxococcaceae bacterium]|nr:tRNA (adenosine(37)-N6)-threonylcarbamoyltransferase complex ATPase subunit type 1 TsaE [Myxococcaceae bacterium]